MNKFVCAIALAVATFALSPTADAACSRVSTMGTAGSKDSAMVQAWEAQLQARGWKGWGTFMASGMKVGSAPGYKSAKIERQRCEPGQLGTVCHITAMLCD